MCSAGRNKFFWPLIEDKIWYTQDKVITLISSPEKLNSRHVQINPAVFEAVFEKLN